MYLSHVAKNRTKCNKSSTRAIVVWIKGCWQCSSVYVDITRATHCISKILFSQLFVFSGFFTCKSSDARGVIKSLCYFQIPKFFKFLKQVFVEQDVILGQNYSLTEVKFFTL